MQLNRFFGDWVRHGYKSFDKWRYFSNSRKQAIELRKKVVKQKGGSCITSKMKNEMKQEMMKRFGDKGHWVWIAFYTEIKGEYKKGWMPNDIYEFEVIRDLNPYHLSAISTIKTFDHRIFEKFSLQPIALYIAHQFYSSDQKLMSYKEFKNKIKSLNHEVVIKPDSGPSGLEHKFLWPDEITSDDFKGGINYVIQPVIRQHDILNRFSLKSVNTLRITTFITKTGDVQFKYIILRFGIGESRIDNMVAGGCMIILDQDGNICSPAYNRLGVKISDVHPDTGLIFGDTKVPGVRKAINKCIVAHTLFPYLRFIAWDVSIDLNANPVLLEWNARCPDILPEEAILGPIWADLEI